MPSLNSKQLAEKKEVEKQQHKETLELILWFAKLPPLNYNNLVQVRNRITEYFEQCASVGAVPGLEGLCNALHVSRKTFNSWADGTARKGTEMQKLCQDAKQILKAYAENGMLTGDINPVPGIFMMTNQYEDYVQKQVVQSDTSISILDTATPEQLAERYGSGSIVDVAYTEKNLVEDTAKQTAAVAKKSKSYKK